MSVEQERAAVVAWLRKIANHPLEMGRLMRAAAEIRVIAEIFATAIEAGAHTKGGE